MTEKNPELEKVDSPSDDMPESMSSSVSIPEDEKPEKEKPEDESSLVNYGDGLPPELLWIKEGENRVLATIYAYKDAESGRLKSITLDVQVGFRDSGYIEYPIESEWSIPTREELQNYKEKASRADINGRFLINRALLQALVIRKHLLALRFRDPDGTMKPLELARDSNGLLTKRALKILGQLHPSVIDLLYLKFVDEAALLI